MFPFLIQLWKSHSLFLCHSLSIGKVRNLPSFKQEKGKGSGKLLEEHEGFRNIAMTFSGSTIYSHEETKAQSS